MKRFRSLAVCAAVAMLAAVVGAALPAAADGTTGVAVSCSGIPLVGTLSTSVSVTASDSVDPVASGGNVTNTIAVPIPVDGSSLPVTVTVSEVDLTIPIPANVTVSNVTFTTSSFTTQTYAVSGSNLVVTLKGSVPVGPSSPVPTVPQVSVVTHVTGAHRIISWTVPTVITAKASAGVLGNVTATCTPSDLSTVLITTEVGSAPVATAQQVSTPENTAKAITLAGSDADGDQVTPIVITGPAHGVLSGTVPNLTYTPTSGYSGSDSVTFATTDGHLTSAAATVSITVVDSNHAPVATAQSVSTAKNVAKSITLAGTDADGDPLTSAVVIPPAHGTLTGAAPNLTYTPQTGYSGSDSFTFKVNDGKADSAPATVSIAVNDTAPIAGSSSISTFANTPVLIDLAAFDADQDPLTVSVVTGPAHGTLTGTPPNVTYTPANNYTGPDSITFKANDGTLDSNQATELITVKPAVLPVATSQAVSLPANGSLPITLAGSIANGHPLTMAVASSPSHGVLTGTAPNLTYTPTADYVGADAFTFTAADGASVSSAATVSITVTAVAPGAPTIGQSVPGEGEVTVNWTAPANRGSSPIIGYKVMPYQGGLAQAVRTFNSTATTQTIDELTDGAGYTFKVAAINASLVGPASALSAGVQPAVCAPFANCQAAVKREYHDFLGVAPTNQVLLAALTQLNGHSITLPAYIASFRTSADHTNNVDPVTRLYRAYFLRIPDVGGLTYWIGQRRAGKSIEAISASFAASNEFKTRYGALSNQAFVELVYQNVLGRPGDAGGISYWTAQLDAKKKNRGQVMVGFSESSEYKRTQTSEVNAAVVYILMLGRAPTQAEFDAAVAELDASTPVATFVQQLMRTTEFVTHIAT